MGVPTLEGGPDLREVSIKLERTACMSWCPAYALTLYGIGVALYEAAVKDKAAADRRRLEARGK